MHNTLIANQPELLLKAEEDDDKKQKQRKEFHKKAEDAHAASYQAYETDDPDQHANAASLQNEAAEAAQSIGPPQVAAHKQMASEHAIHVGARGGKFLVSGTGKREYIKSLGPELYLDSKQISKSVNPIKWAREWDKTNAEFPFTIADLDDPKHNPPLFLANVDKANSHRDPSMGQFISGVTHPTKSKQGLHDLSSIIESIMDLPGEDLRKPESRK